MYTLQGFIHEIGFPNLCLENVLMKIYDAEILSEEVLVEWFNNSDDIAEWKSYGGRGTAKLESQAFITWLQEADEDESGEEEG